MLCLGGFLANLWVPLGDALDASFPGRQVVSRHARGESTWDIAVAPEALDNADVRSALGVLSPAYAELVRDFGGQLVITRVDALSQVRTSSQRELTYTAGVYFAKGRVAYIAHDSGDPGWTALHELAHMLDHALGELSGRVDFVDVYEQLRTDERLNPYARTNSQECFAELFTRYYFSDRRRGHLADRFPLASRYMASLEQRVISKTYK